jgi:uncharacterized protein YfaS (alpha-2-macroglobulin family)
MHARRSLYLCLVIIVLVASLGWPGGSANSALLSSTPTPVVSTSLSARLDGGRAEAFDPNLPLRLRFNRAIDPASAAMPVLTDPYLVGAYAWSEANQVVTFKPEGGFRPGSTYTIYLDPQLRGADGAGFDPLPHWSLHTLAAPSLISVQPPSGLLQDQKPTIHLTFDRAMDHASVAVGLTAQPLLSLDLTWQGDTLAVTPRAALTPGSSFELSLAADVKDAQGVALGQESRSSYWIDSLRTSTGLVTTNSFDLFFNYAVDNRGGELPFQLEPAQAGKWSWVDERTARFNAEGYFSPALSYSVKVSAPLKSPFGGTYALPEALSLTLPRAVDSYGPGVKPEGELITQSPDIWILFNYPVDEKSVEAAFSTSPRVPGQFYWSGRRVIFSPSEPFPDKAKVSVQLSRSALDSAGRPLLGEAVSWTFHTFSQTAFDSSIHFGQVGTNMQVFDANGRKAVQFVIEGKLEQTAIFSLYRVEKGNFAALYRDYFGSLRTWELPKLADGSKLEKIKTWPVKGSGILETLLPAGLEPGSYLLHLGGERGPYAQMILLVSRYKLTLKRSSDRMWLWATDYAGANVQGLHVRLYVKSGEIQREGDTDSQGIFSTSLPAESAPMLATAMDKAGDLSAVGFTSEWQGDTRTFRAWGNDFSAPQPARPYQTYLYTERPIYRPGQTVYFKALARGDDDVHYSLPKTGTKVTLRLLDTRGNEVQRQELAFNDYGSLNGSFALGDGAMLGDYTIEASLDGQVFQQIFAVQEYRKPDYQVEVKTAANAYVEGDTVVVDVDARYFFGQPVEHANFYPTLYDLTPKSYNGWWQDVDFETSPLLPGDFVWQTSYGRETLASESSDENGHVSFGFVAARHSEGYGSCRSSWRSPLRECYLGLEIRARDSSGQEVTISKVLRLYSAPVKLTIDRGDWLKRPGVAFDLQISGVNLKGLPETGRAVRIVAYLYNNRGNYSEVFKKETHTDEKGKTVVALSLEQEGYYEIKMTDLDTKGDSFYDYSSTWLYVSKRTTSTPGLREVRIQVERSQYKPYEKAKIIIASPFDGPALLTFERRQVIHTKAVMLTAPLTEVEVEIIPEDAPNIFVVVNAWENENLTLADVLKGQSENHYNLTQNLRDARLYTAQTELVVDTSASRLSVTIEPDKPSYLPGQEAMLKVRVRDARGQPVQAELSLALVDEAIFSLSADRSGSIFDAFYARREHNVRTYNSLALSRFLFYSGGAGGGGDANLPPSANLRSNFQDLAAWLPAVRTDASGLAELRVKLPDNLTSWRATVKAATAGSLFGEASVNILAQKDLLVRPLLPQELVSGDTLALSAVVHNYAPQARSLNVTLEASGLSLLDPASQTVKLAPGAELAVSWQVRAGPGGAAAVTIRALSEDGAEDSVRLPVILRPRAVSTVLSQSGDFSAAFTTRLDVAPHLLAGSSVQLKLSRSIGGNLMSGLEYLTGYPYGCVEQTMSKALPNAVVGRALSKLGIDKPGLVKELPGLVSGGLQRLYGYQHNDGGWGWWYDDETDIYQSAWVVFGLAVTREAGYAVDAKVIERGAKYLQAQLDSGNLKDARTRAYTLYSLARAGYASRAQTLQMAGQVHSLDAFSQAALALALNSLGETQQARAVLETLDAGVLVKADQAYWVGDSSDGHYHEKTMSSTVRTSALGLSAYLAIAPGHARISQLVRYLMSQRKVEGWGSTNETAYTLLALTDYLLAQQEQEGEMGYQVLLDGSEVSSGSFAAGASAISIDLPLERLQPGAHALKLVGSGTGRIYYSLNSRYLLDLPTVESAGTVQIKRTYIDEASHLSVTRSEEGRLIRVQLKILGGSAPLSYVLLEDHLPAGLEALNESLNTTSHDGSQQEYDNQTYSWIAIDPQNWRKLFYNNKEIHGSRVSFFFTNMSVASEQTVTYLARATQSGEFYALPAELSAMYDPAVWGRSAGSTLTVKPLK